jgi:diguanylate cyclase (GGDEF)-like protein
MEKEHEAIATTRALLEAAARATAARPDACTAIYSHMIDGVPWLKLISEVDLNGRITCSSNPGSIGLNISDREHFQQAISTGEFVMSGYYPLPRRIDGPAMFAAVPRFAEDGTIDAVMIGVLNLDWIAQLASATSQLSRSVVLMVDGTGTVITRYPDPETWSGRTFADHPLIRDMLARSEGAVHQKGLDGVDRVFGFVQLPHTKVRFAVGLDLAEPLRRVNGDTWIAYGQLGVVAFAMLLAIWLGGQRLIVRPIRLLVQRTNKIGYGEFRKRRANARWASELAPLVNAIDQMASQLAAREHELREANARLKELSRIDPLTGLANRRKLKAQLTARWRRAGKFRRSIALLMIDIDHFKLFNDRYGHVEGDGCLRRVGKLLREIAREVDDLPARYGGEEFALLLPGADVERALEIAERLRRAVEALGITHADSPLGQVTVSIGVAAMVPIPGQDAEKLVEAADAGLYAAKRRGRNTVVAHGAVVVLAEPVQGHLPSRASSRTPPAVDPSAAFVA